MHNAADTQGNFKHATRTTRSAMWRWMTGASMLIALLNGAAAQNTAATSATGSAASSPRPASVKQEGNRIEVTSNSVSNVRCANGGSVSVNSVNVNGASLQGRTVIVQGHNTGGEGQQIDCTQQGDAKNPAPSQINSITIR